MYKSGLKKNFNGYLLTILLIDVSPFIRGLIFSDDPKLNLLLSKL